MQESDQTGMENGGGGGIVPLLFGGWCGCGRDNALTPLVKKKKGSSMTAHAVARAKEELRVDMVVHLCAENTPSRRRDT